jgi:hypothetical protein
MAKNPILITFHILITLIKLCLSGGVRRIVAEDILIKQQLIVMKRSQPKCPALLPVERLLFGFWTMLLNPTSHPFIERLIGSCRREYMDHIFFFNEIDLMRKLNRYMEYYNKTRVHYSLGGKVPSQKAGDLKIKQTEISSYHQKSYCNGMFKVPVAA